MAEDESVPREVVALLETVGLPSRQRIVLSNSEEAYPGPFRVTLAATASVAAATAVVARFMAGEAEPPAVAVDGRHAAVAFRSERHVHAPAIADAGLWDRLSGNYRCVDGWVRLHTNLSVHRRAALDVLGVKESLEEVRAAVGRWPASDLEEAVVFGGGVAAALRTRDEWAETEQAAAVRARPLIDLQPRDASPAPAAAFAPSSPGVPPLAGLRVVDLTRVIAGPVATRFLAAHGADVVRVDAPHLEDGLLLEIDTSPGKRRCWLDLRESTDRKAFEQLVAGADVLVQSYRPGALARLGYSDTVLRALRPGLVVGNLSAYGDQGPWGDRRGFDSIVQVATGLAHASGFSLDEGPGALPAQALDHASGYLLALGLLAALIRRNADGSGWSVDVSLARTGDWLDGLGRRPVDEPPPEPPDVASFVEAMDTPEWGSITLVRPPGELASWQPRWAFPPPPAGAHRPTWHS